ncbi:ras-related protein Rab-20-like [Amphiura filiformis]|uniref:ras-related protein Rab-20-like n=1 Tax=Amphiura filiformis TaxID=82378 RepID=UPI003B226600
MSTPVGQKKKADVKVVILGDAGVGKTTFIRRYVERQFTENVSTVGAAFIMKQWANRHIAIWDTAGEERFSGLSSFYCRDASAAIIAYDITDRRTFELLQERYLPLLEAAKEDCLLCVTAMKQDLLTDSNRAVPQEEAERFALQMNANRYRDTRNAPRRKPYFETSALSGQNVDEVFEFIFTTLFGRQGNSGNPAPRKGVINVDGSGGSGGRQSTGGCC